MRTILVAGATGHLGREVVDQLAGSGYKVRALTRDPSRLASRPHVTAVRGDLTDPDSLRTACEGADAVISCAGASLTMGRFGDRQRFSRVDHEGNRALLRTAQTSGVRRFVYVSLFGAERVAGTEYADAHERFVRELADSGMSHVVVRPTGFFSFLAEFVRLAARGFGPVMGDGRARMNPVHETDVAIASVAALAGEDREIAIGGPQVLTRQEMVELAFAAIGRTPRLTHVSPRVIESAAALLRPVQPRIAALMHFGARISQVDVIAPAVGTRRIEDYFRDVALRMGIARSSST